MKKPVVNLHKYFKRIIALMDNPVKASAFKRLILEATHAEKIHQENSRRTKEKNSAD